MRHENFDVKLECQGRWRGILSALGVSERALSGKGAECPICQNGPQSDRFRFDDKDGRGTWICSSCGAGDGVLLVEKLRGVDFRGAIPILRELVGKAVFVAPKAKLEATPEVREEMASLWRLARPLDGLCLASRYLHSRGIKNPPAGFAVRFFEALPYAGEKVVRLLPAMLAKFVSPDAKSAILHRTWLAEPGEKADVEHPRKMWRGTIPEGGAVRLSPAGETMGISEGLETAMAAETLNRIPVWACTSAAALVKFQPPPECRHLIIFADNDASFTGQLAGYSLARRLTSVPAGKRIGVEVRLPGYHDVGDPVDWNDVLLSELRDGISRAVL
jgi:putative DNA primase/helicase